MTVRVRLLLCLATTLALTAGCQSSPSTSHSPQASRAPDAAETPHADLGVEQLATSPATYVGRPLSLRGVVATTASERQMFTVIDEAEYNSCRELGCAAYEVPISFAGALPETARVVRIAGRLTQLERGRYLVLAERVETLP